MLADKLRAVSAVKPFSPLDLSPSLWLDASDSSTITQSSGAVSQWNDKSGNGRDVSQATGSRQPVTGTRTIGGLNAIDFASQYLKSASSYTLMDATTGVYTAFGVFIVDAISATAGQIVCLDGNNSTRMPQMLRVINATVETVRISPTTVTDASASSLNTSSAFIGSGVLSTSTLEARINGATNGAASITNANSVTAVPIGVGANLRFEPSALFNGAIGEIIVYPSVLSNSEMNSVGNYLSSKWSITWNNL